MTDPIERTIGLNAAVDALAQIGGLVADVMEQIAAFGFTLLEAARKEYELAGEPNGPGDEAMVEWLKARRKAYDETLIAMHEESWQKALRDLQELQS